MQRPSSSSQSAEFPCTTRTDRHTHIQQYKRIQHIKINTTNRLKLKLHFSRQTDTHAYHEAPTTDMPIHRKDPIDVNVYLHTHTYSSIYTHTHTKQSNQSQCLVSCLFTFLSNRKTKPRSTLYTLPLSSSAPFPQTTCRELSSLFRSTLFMYILSLYCV